MDTAGEALPRNFVPCPFPKIHPSELLRDDAYFMAHAYNMALQAWMEDEVPIGAVIVHQGEIIGRGYNRVEAMCDPTAHAEIIAFTAAAAALKDWRLNGTTLYVTKEPCPMCSGACFMARVSRVVYAVGDPKMGCLGGATNLNDLPRLNHHINITNGVFEQECLELLRAYFALKRRSSATD